LLKKKRFAWLALLLAFGLVAAACGDDDSSTSDTTAGGDSSDCPADVEGELSVTGSSTVEPISTAVGEKLLDCSGIAATVDGPGTGDGLAAFCAGGDDAPAIADASRQIKDEEAATCETNGVEFIEVKIAFDGISVLTNPNNDVECLNFADLYAIFGPESEGFDTWQSTQALATELGSATVMPDADLPITAPGAESGTYDSFNEIVFKSISEERAAAGDITEDQISTSRPDYASQADDTAIISAMEADDAPWGFVGFAFAEEAGDQVKEISVAPEAGTDCVAPSADTIADGSYPISRSLYLYVNKAQAEANPAVAGYVDFYLSDTGVGSVSEVGYVDLPADQLQASRDTWEARTAGTAAG
jgi:phosphate transport system substrate-binding protein